jgi:hypothetical protein
MIESLQLGRLLLISLLSLYNAEKLCTSFRSNSLPFMSEINLKLPFNVCRSVQGLQRLSQGSTPQSQLP